jgi:hypothetical protein
MTASFGEASPKPCACSGTHGEGGSFSRAAYVAEQANPRAGGAAPPQTAPRPPNAPPRPNAPNDPSERSVPNAPNDSNVPNDPKAAAQLLRRVVDAKGGLPALKAVKTVIADAETTLQMQQGTLPSSTKTYVAYPDKFRVDAEVNGARTTQVYNAGRAWVQSPAGIQEAPPGMLAEFAASVRRDTIPMLIDAAEGRLTVRTMPPQTGRNGRMVQVLEISGQGLDPVRLYIDEQMAIAGQAFSRADPTGRPILTEEVFSDYREVNGVRVPFEAQLLQNGQPILKRTLTKVALNEPVSDSVFTRPLSPRQ